MANKRSKPGRELCPVCGRALLPAEGVGALADGSLLCSHCVRKLRVMYPLREDFVKGHIQRSDALNQATLETVREQIGTVSAYIDGLRAQNGGSNALFLVETVEAERGGLLKPPCYSVRGRVLYGSFDPMDRAVLLHGGTETEIELEIDLDTQEWKSGRTWVLRFSGKGLEVAPGDRIVRR